MPPPPFTTRPSPLPYLNNHPQTPPPPPTYSQQSAQAPFSPSTQSLPIRDRGTPTRRISTLNTTVDDEKDNTFRNGEPISPSTAESKLTAFLKVDFEHQTHCQACLLSHNVLLHCTLCPRSLHPSISCLPSDLSPNANPSRPFLCPQHRCHECFSSESKRTRKSSFFFRCRLCDSAYCEACLRSEIGCSIPDLGLKTAKECPELVSLGYDERNERVRYGVCDVCSVRRQWDLKGVVEKLDAMVDGEGFSFVVWEAVGKEKEGRCNLGRVHCEGDVGGEGYWFQPEYQPGNVDELQVEVEEKIKQQEKRRREREVLDAGAGS